MTHQDNTTENLLWIDGRAWPIPERFSRSEVRLIRHVSGLWRRRAIVRAIQAGEPVACVAFVLALMRRADPAATLDDARRSIGVSELG